MYFLINNKVDYNLISFWINIGSLLLALIAFIFGTWVTVWIFKRNRKNYIYKVKEKIDRLIRYIEKIQKYNRNLYLKEISKKTSRYFNIFYTMEYLIMNDISNKIKNSTGFLDWKEYNAIINSILYNKKNIRKCNKELKKFRYLLKNYNISQNHFKIVLFSRWDGSIEFEKIRIRRDEGVAFNLYGQFVDNKILEKRIQTSIEDEKDEGWTIGFTRPYNIYKFIKFDHLEDALHIESSSDFDINKYLNFNLFYFYFRQTKWNGKYDNNFKKIVENYIKNLEKIVSDNE